MKFTNSRNYTGTRGNATPMFVGGVETAGSVFQASRSNAHPGVAGWFAGVSIMAERHRQKKVQNFCDQTYQ
jgi:hypothetical protein